MSSGGVILITVGGDILGWATEPAKGLQITVAMRHQNDDLIGIALRTLLCIARDQRHRW
jgi:hypothetical protein